MKRLSDNAIEIVNELHTERLAYEGEYVPIIDALNRLAEYEDTGLEPKEIEDMVSVREITPEAEYAIDKHANNLIQKLEQLIAQTDEKNELRRYKDAEEQGLLVRLPCKVGDTVYKLCPISGFLNIGDRWDGRIITGDCDRCEWCCCDCYDIAPMFDGHHRNIVHEIKNISLKTIIQIMPHFGRTIFLTREAAEKALEEV